jgi:hypothetical protein
MIIIIFNFEINYLASHSLSRNIAFLNHVGINDTSKSLGNIRISYHTSENSAEIQHVIIYFLAPFFVPIVPFPYSNHTFISFPPSPVKTVNEVI